MAKAPKGSNSTSTTAKSGKKHRYTDPPAPKPEKLAAREQGRQQFQAKEFPKPLPSPKGSWDAAMDVLCLAFGVRRVRTRKDDVGHRWDPNRKQFVYPPNTRTDER